MVQVVFVFFGIVAISTAQAPNLDIPNSDNLSSLTDFSAVTDFVSLYNKYLTQFNKTYSAVEKVARFDVFKRNCELISKHNNARGNTYTMGLTPFTDIKYEEFVSRFLGIDANAIELDLSSRRETETSTVGASSIPVSVNWTAEGYVTRVKSQGSCGSCWIFSATGAIEGQHFRKHKELISLSEQNIVDCAGRGCKGGWMTTAFNYAKNYTLNTESQYPYKAKTGTCEYKSSPNSGVKVTGYRYVLPRKNETALTEAVYKQGPISVAIHVSKNFMHYKYGVFYDESCGSKGVSHGVLVTGYGTYNDEAFYSVKNSWGAQWGEKGYIRMARNRDNNCQIASHGIWPTVE